MYWTYARVEAREGWVSVFKMSGLWIFYYVLIIESMRCLWDSVQVKRFLKSLRVDILMFESGLRDLFSG